jgi:hypothetical protein
MVFRVARILGEYVFVEGVERESRDHSKSMRVSRFPEVCSDSMLERLIRIQARFSASEYLIIQTRYRHLLGPRSA